MRGAPLAATRARLELKNVRAAEKKISAMARSICSTQWGALTEQQFASRVAEEGLVQAPADLIAVARVDAKRRAPERYGGVARTSRRDMTSDDRRRSAAWLRQLGCASRDAGGRGFVVRYMLKKQDQRMPVAYSGGRLVFIGVVTEEGNGWPGNRRPAYMQVEAEYPDRQGTFLRWYVQFGELHLLYTSYDPSARTVRAAA